MYKTVYTNLNAEDFPPEKIKQLYNLRWGIETSFKELKYAVGLASLHSKKKIARDFCQTNSIQLLFHYHAPHQYS
ncbi:transposase [Desulfosporosinus meridiei]|uniref:transposase n=1 Tax=Desulfosporosinus meridiei TaxID=79209 RepID=UPI0002FA825A|nr:transposase [Desulfosporosinus meridiei]